MLPFSQQLEQKQEKKQVLITADALCDNLARQGTRSSPAMDTLVIKAGSYADGELIRIFTTLAKNQSIVRLRIEGVDLSKSQGKDQEKDENFVKLLSTHIGQNKALKFLELPHCNLSDEAGKEIINALTPREMISIDLGNNPLIGTLTCRELAKQLPTLVFRDPNSPVQALLGAFKKFKNALWFLDLQNTKISSGDLTELFKSIEKNKIRFNRLKIGACLHSPERKELPHYQPIDKMLVSTLNEEKINSANLIDVGVVNDENICKTIPSPNPLVGKQLFINGKEYCPLSDEVPSSAVKNLSSLMTKIVSGEDITEELKSLAPSSVEGIFPSSIKYSPNHTRLLPQAIAMRREALVKLLVEKHDANPCYASPLRPLMIAAYAGSCEIVEFLLTKGALFKEKNWFTFSGDSALTYAIYGGDLKVFEPLLNHCSEEFIKHYHNRTLPVLAVVCGRIDMAVALVKKGALYKYEKGVTYGNEKDISLDQIAETLGFHEGAKVLSGVIAEIEKKLPAVSSTTETAEKKETKKTPGSKPFSKVSPKERKAFWDFRNKSSEDSFMPGIDKKIIREHYALINQAFELSKPLWEKYSKNKSMTKTNFCRAMKILCSELERTNPNGYCQGLTDEDFSNLFLIYFMNYLGRLREDSFHKIVASFSLAYEPGHGWKTGKPRAKDEINFHCSALNTFRAAKTAFFAGVNRGNCEYSLLIDDELKGVAAYFMIHAIPPGYDSSGVFHYGIDFELSTKFPFLHRGKLEQHIPLTSREPGLCFIDLNGKRHDHLNWILEQVPVAMEARSKSIEIDGTTTTALTYIDKRSKEDFWTCNCTSGNIWGLSSLECKNCLTSRPSNIVCSPQLNWSGCCEKSETNPSTGGQCAHCGYKRDAIPQLKSFCYHSSYSWICQNEDCHSICFHEDTSCDCGQLAPIEVFAQRGLHISAIGINPDLKITARGKIIHPAANSTIQQLVARAKEIRGKITTYITDAASLKIDDQKRRSYVEELKSLLKNECKDELHLHRPLIDCIVFILQRTEISDDDKRYMRDLYTDLNAFRLDKSIEMSLQIENQTPKDKLLLIKHAMEVVIKSTDIKSTMSFFKVCRDTFDSLPPQERSFESYGYIINAMGSFIKKIEKTLGAQATLDYALKIYDLLQEANKVTSGDYDPTLFLWTIDLINRYNNQKPANYENSIKFFEITYKASAALFKCHANLLRIPACDFFMAYDSLRDKLTDKKKYLERARDLYLAAKITDENSIAIEKELLELQAAEEKKLQELQAAEMKLTTAKCEQYFGSLFNSQPMAEYKDQISNSRESCENLAAYLDTKNLNQKYILQIQKIFKGKTIEVKKIAKLIEQALKASKAAQKSKEHKAKDVVIVVKNVEKEKKAALLKEKQNELKSLLIRCDQSIHKFNSLFQDRMVQLQAIRLKMDAQAEENKKLYLEIQNKTEKELVDPEDPKKGLIPTYETIADEFAKLADLPRKFENLDAEKIPRSGGPSKHKNTKKKNKPKKQAPTDPTPQSPSETKYNKIVNLGSHTFFSRLPTQRLLSDEELKVITQSQTVTPEASSKSPASPIPEIAKSLASPRATPKPKVLYPARVRYATEEWKHLDHLKMKESSTPKEILSLAYIRCLIRLFDNFQFINHEISNMRNLLRHCRAYIPNQDNVIQLVNTILINHKTFLAFLTQASSFKLASEPLYQELDKFHHSHAIIKAMQDNPKSHKNLRKQLIQRAVTIFNPTWEKHNCDEKKMNPEELRVELFAIETLFAKCGEICAVSTCNRKIESAKKAKNVNSQKYYELLKHCRIHFYPKYGHPPKKIRFEHIIQAFKMAKDLTPPEQKQEEKSIKRLTP